MKQTWTKGGAEPRLWDVLADPIVLSVMQADRVSRKDVLRATVIALKRTQRTDPEMQASAA